MKIPDHKKVELFCGTGGVGKTTLATARAMALAELGKRVLLITIDPAKRLKQILNLTDTDDGNIQKVNVPDSDHSFDALLMSPRKTLERMAIEKNLTHEFNSTIIKTLSKPYGGMNEIMSIIEVQYHLDQNHYDVIVLDTPPGKHFIDFLESSEKIKNFFDKTFLEIFEYIGSTSKKQGILGTMMATGIKKLLSYLETVTGADFVTEFIQAVLALYRCRDAFLKALEFHQELKNPNYSNWFLVTSVEQQKLSEAQSLKKQAEHFMHNDLFLVINKCQKELLLSWNPLEPELLSLKSGIMSREDGLTEFASKNFRNVLKFHEVNHSSPIEQVKQLATCF